jgi:hypothetical protein
MEPKDFGDAPAPYRTTVAQDGAVHAVYPGYMLGTLVDVEPDGAPTVQANGDDTTGAADEDGVTFVTSLEVGQTAEISVFFTQAGDLATRPAQGYLQGWIDFNKNGVWGDRDEEHIVVNGELDRGANRFTFPVPSWAVSDYTYARFRLGLSGGAGPHGAGGTGEVEDYRVYVSTQSRPDVVGRTATGTWVVAQNTGTQFSTQVWGGGVEADGWYDVMSGDFNNDGLTDVVGRANDGRWHVLVNTGSGFSDQIWGRTNGAINWNDVAAADFTGNGFLDIVARTDTGEWWVAPNTGSSFAPIQYWGRWNRFVTWLDVQVGDFTNDGRADVLARSDLFSEWWLAVSSGSRFNTRYYGRWNGAAGWTDVMSGDFTGDGRLDVVGRTATGEWWVAANDGSRLLSSFWGRWDPGAMWQDVTAVDITGDGLVDIVGRNTRNNEWWVAVNEGGRFSTRFYGRDGGAGWTDALFADFDDDGLIDIMARATRPSSSGEWWLFRNTGSRFLAEYWGSWNETLGWQDVDAGFFSS